MKCPNCENQIGEIHSDKLIECHACGFFRREGGVWTPAASAGNRTHEVPEETQETPQPEEMAATVESDTQAAVTPSAEVHATSESSDTGRPGPTRKPVFELEFFGPEIE